MQKIELEYSLATPVQLDAGGGEPLHVTVSELAQSIRRQLEVGFDSVRVRGEISGFRGPHASGHVYFGLKEGSVRLDAVIWSRAYAQMPFKPEEGLEVFASGRISTFPQKSSYQLVVTSLEPAGAGALMALLEERRRMLAAESVFDASRKRPLPFLPRTIAAITSPSGSVVHDMIHRISARFPRLLLVWPVRVQGDGAAAEIVNALTRLNALPANGAIPRPDVIILARGGGSLQDLWSFNDEALVRAVAASAIPVISAIGHQTDWTLADYAADVRAPTPTAAAELCIPVLADLAARGQSLAARLSGAVRQLHTNWRRQAHQAYMGVKNQRVLLLTSFQRLTLAASLLERNTLVRDYRARFAQAALTLTRNVRARRDAMPTQRAHTASLFARLGLRTRQMADERATTAARQATDLVRVFRGNVEQRALGFAALDRTLHLRRATLVHVVATRRQALVHGYAGLAAKCRDLLSAFRSDLSERGKIMMAVSYKGVLERGFALVRGPSGETLHRADEARRERALTLEFADGQIAVSVGTARRKKSVATVEQKALF